MSKGTITCTACAYVFAVPANARAAICPKCGQAQPVLSGEIEPANLVPPQRRQRAATRMGLGSITPPPDRPSHPQQPLPPSPPLPPQYLHKPSQPPPAQLPEEPSKNEARVAKIRLRKLAQPPPLPGSVMPASPPVETSADDKTIPDFSIDQQEAPDLPPHPEQMTAELPPEHEPLLPPGFAQPPGGEEDQEYEQGYGLEDDLEDDLDERDTLHLDPPPWKGAADRMQEPEFILNTNGPAIDLSDLSDPSRSQPAPPAPHHAAPHHAAPHHAAPPPSVPDSSERTEKWRPSSTSERVAALDQAISDAIEPAYRREPPVSLDNSGIMVVIPGAPVEEVVGGQQPSRLGTGGGGTAELAPITPKTYRSPKGYGIALKKPPLRSGRGMVILAGGIALAILAGVGLLIFKLYS